MKSKGTRWLVIYGSLTEPSTRLNFVCVRIPSGRVPWRKKIVPAIERLVRPWYDTSSDRN
jgi:hypothetical protein